MKMTSIQRILAIKACSLCTKDDIKTLQNFLCNTSSNISEVKKDLMQDLQLLLNWIKWIKINQGKVAMMQGMSTL